MRRSSKDNLSSTLKGTHLLVSNYHLLLFNGDKTLPPQSIPSGSIRQEIVLQGISIPLSAFSSQIPLTALSCHNLNPTHDVNSIKLSHSQLSSAAAYSGHMWRSVITYSGIHRLCQAVNFLSSSSASSLSSFASSPPLPFGSTSTSTTTSTSLLNSVLLEL